MGRIAKTVKLNPKVLDLSQALGDRISLPCTGTVAQRLGSCGWLRKW
ncbi:MAG: hypothetical protein ACPLQP_06985 [Moorellaceae bacterium]